VGAELGHPVVEVLDVLTGTRRRADGSGEPVRFPSADVLAYTLADGTRITLRPSGTEPKLKLYLELQEPASPGEPLAATEARARARLEPLVASVAALARRI
jgi:phosphomannomutase